VNSKIVSFFMWHILFSLRIAARQHRHDMPPNHPITNFRALLPGDRLDPNLTEVTALIEKPTLQQAPSRLASIGRYVLEPEIFDILRAQEPGHGGEIQLTDAINSRAKQGHVCAVTLTGQRYDCGSKFGYLEAIVDFALAHEEYGDNFEVLLRQRLGIRETERHDHLGAPAAALL